MGMTMTVETITPEKAREYLKQNTDNYRKISKAKVGLYAEEMKAGRWELNGEGIMFDESGTLKNGQHRLAAILQAGTAVEMTVIRGVADGVNIYDSGSNRSLAQIANASVGGEMTNTETAVGNAVVGNFYRAPKGQVINYIRAHYEDIRRAFRLCNSKGSGHLSRRMSCVMASYLMLRLEKMQSFQVEMFFQIFNSGNTVGADGYEPSSALVARRMFVERYKTMSSNQKEMRNQTEIMVLAMEDFAKGKKRQMNYQLKDQLHCMELLRQVRKADGLE